MYEKTYGQSGSHALCPGLKAAPVLFLLCPSRVCAFTIMTHIQCTYPEVCACPSHCLTHCFTNLICVGELSKHVHREASVLLMAENLLVQFVKNARSGVKQPVVSLTACSCAALRPVKQKERLI